MSTYYDQEAIKHYVSQAIEDGKLGTQTRLAEAVGVPQPTVNKWKQQHTCPSPKYWEAIEQFFGWDFGTIAGVGGMAALQTTELEGAILRAGELTMEKRDVLLRIYRLLVAGDTP